MHTIVIRAADQHEDGGVVRKRAWNGTGVTNLALAVRFPTLALEYLCGYKIVHRKLQKERSHCSGATLGR